MNNYDDIINLPHHVSTAHPQMSILDRAAQFSPFAALTGYDDAVKETARLTDTKIELDEYEKTILNERLRLVTDCIEEYPEITITYYKPDSKKNGGAYITVTGCVKKIDDFEKTVYMTDGMVISIEEIFEIESDLFQEHFGE
ncbi:MAG: hypothetical protein RR764_02420 [Oscillospiraceae bacterium]